MILKNKIAPIHSKQQDKGKRLSLNQRIKRNKSSHNNQTAEIPFTSNRKIYKKTERNIQTAPVNVRNCNTAPSNFITNLSAFENGPFVYNQTIARNISQRKKKSMYLSRRFIQKKILQSYLDNVFNKVSLIRTTEEKPISSFTRGRIYLSASNTAR